MTTTLDSDFPNLFNHSIIGHDGYFSGLDGLYELDFYKLEKNNEEYLKQLYYYDINYSDELVFIKDFNTYKIMITVLFFEGSCNEYYISSKVLLDSNNNIIKNLYNNNPSIVIFSRNFINSFHKETRICEYFSFYDNFYSHVEIEEFDSYNDKYIFYFRSFNNSLIASAVYNSSNLKNIPYRNCNFYILGKQYDLQSLISFDNDFQNKNFIDIVEYISYMDNVTKNLFDMYLI